MEKNQPGADRDAVEEKMDVAGTYLRRIKSNIVRQCLQWNLQGKRPRARPKSIMGKDSRGDEGSRL